MKLAIVSSYDETCAIASYVKTLEKTFKQSFDVTVLDLKSAALVGNPSLYNTPAAEEHIDRICRDLATYDCVNIQLEWGLFGADFPGMQRHLLKLFNASKRLIVTLHTLNVRAGDSPEWQAMERHVLLSLKERPADRPYWVITHLPREAESLRILFGMDNVVDFPLVFLSRQDVAEYQKSDAAAWKASMGFKKEDIVILRFGFFAEHKDAQVSLKLMSLLPPNYKLAFAGGQHPRGITPYVVSPLVKEITDFIDQFDAKALDERVHNPDAKVITLGDRISFLGHLSEPDFYRAAACADFITLTHMETSQGGSGTASVALQMERPTILSYNSFFMEYEKYYEGAFSFFAIGNHYELRDKILNFDPAKAERLKEYGRKYSIDGLAALCAQLYQNMLDGKGNNAGRPVAMQATAIPTNKSLAYRVFFKTLSVIKRVRNQVRRIKEKIRTELA